MERQVEEDAGTWGVEAGAMKLRARVAERQMSKPAAFTEGCGTRPLVNCRAGPQGSGLYFWW